VITASGLAPDCGYAKILSASKPRTPEQTASMARGTAFHGLIEAWVKNGRVPETEDMEIQGWVDLMAADWWPVGHTFAEISWGLTMDGGYIDVAEPTPHEYVAALDGKPVPLLTAGRADLAWTDEDGMLRVPDLKTGRWPVTAAVDNLQVNAAGIALAQRLFARGYVPGVYYARDGAWDWGLPVEVGSPAWNASLASVTAAALLPPEPQPGDYCEKCWERKRCPAYKP
jgi:hypothetical protein